MDATDGKADATLMSLGGLSIGEISATKIWTWALVGALINLAVIALVQLASSEERIDFDGSAAP